MGDFLWNQSQKVQTFSATIHWLKELFTRYECPDAVVMDNVPQFALSEFQQFLTTHGIHALMTFICNPRENGPIECWNRTLKFAFRSSAPLGRSGKTESSNCLHNTGTCHLQHGGHHQLSYYSCAKPTWLSKLPCLPCLLHTLHLLCLWHQMLPLLTLILASSVT